MFDKKSLSWLTSKLSLIFTVILLYWIVVFISITVFGFKIFRENLTQIFYLSVVGILAILLGSALLNIMTNIAIIADNTDKQAETSVPKRKLFAGGLLVLLSFVIVFGGLYMGDRLNSAKKEQYLVASAKRLYKDHTDKFSVMDRYNFSPTFVSELGQKLRVISQQDKNFQYVSVIVKGSIDGEPVFLNFAPVYSKYEIEDFDKADFILPTTMEERDYLNRIFAGESEELRYSSSDGEYELYFPINGGKTKYILYLSEHQPYGKFGS